MSLDTLLIESQRELIEAQAERIRLLGELLAECADDLEAELRDRWCVGPDGGCHPALKAKFDRDMVVVDRARAASADTHPKDGDVQQAPLVSGAVPKADAQTPSPTGGNS
jgi:hypothetical protein